jgi:hypothetical protein
MVLPPTTTIRAGRRRLNSVRTTLCRSLVPAVPIAMRPRLRSAGQFSRRALRSP